MKCEYCLGQKEERQKGRGRRRQAAGDEPQGAPYSLKDGDVIAVVDRHEDPEGRADLTRADDEVSTNDGSQEFFLPTSVVPAVVFFFTFFCPCKCVWQFFCQLFFCQFCCQRHWCQLFFSFCFLSL